MKRYEIEVWLGDDHGLTDEQVDTLAATALKIGRRYPPGPDYDDEREAALTVACRLMVEDTPTVLADLSTDLLAARIAEVRALAAIRQCAATLVRPSSKGARGITTAAGFAAAVGVDRQAVLGWLGKR